MLVCFWERERDRDRDRDRVWAGRGRERGRPRIRSRLQALSCQHRAWRGAQTHRLWDHDLSWSWLPNRLSHPGAPKTFFLMLIYFWERKTEQEWGRGRERGRHRIGSRFQALSCQHRAWHGAWTRELRDHDLSRSRTLNQLSYPGAPSTMFSRVIHIVAWACAFFHCVPERYSACGCTTSCSPTYQLVDIWSFILSFSLLK